MDFRVILPSACYSYDEATGLYTDLRESEVLKFVLNRLRELRAGSACRAARFACRFSLPCGANYVQA